MFNVYKVSGVKCPCCNSMETIAVEENDIFRFDQLTDEEKLEILPILRQKMGVSDASIITLVGSYNTRKELDKALSKTKKHIN